MGPTYLQRTIEPVIRKAAAEFPAVMLTGPRQSGKTTLLKHVFGDSYGYVSLETPDVRDAAIHDPRGFLEMHPPPVIFDEVQHATGLLPYVKQQIDAHRDRPGQYVVTGSQNLLLAEHVSESLAGRVAVLRLLPFSRREAEGRPKELLPWESDHAHNGSPLLSHSPLWERLLRGWYPELVAQRDRDIQLWHASYVQTYLERDVRTLRQVGDLSQFQSFLRALAARTGQLLNATDLARDLGVAVNTIKAWLSVLEATHQITILRPYFANVGKRLVKTPKVYFTDTGTLCYLAGLRDPLHAASGPMGGAILEAAVLAEITKALAHQGTVPQVYFWRTSAGVEVDFLIEWGDHLVPVEVKLSATPRPAMRTSIMAFRKDLGEKALPGYVVHAGDITLPMGDGVLALPFGRL